MRTQLRKMGHSRGVVIPLGFLEACGLGDEVELRVEGNRLVIEALRTPRKDWFEHYVAKEDDDVWGDLPVDADAEDWQW
jgi:antitoxin MazE